MKIRLKKISQKKDFISKFGPILTKIDPILVLKMYINIIGLYWHIIIFYPRGETISAVLLWVAFGSAYTLYLVFFSSPYGTEFFPPKLEHL